MVHLYVSESFRDHRVTKTDISDLKEWQFEIGQAATDAFHYGLQSRFSECRLKLGAPSFPVDSAEANFVAVVVPEFTRFSATDPIVFKFENYTVTFGFTVKVYDARGSELLSRGYSGRSEKRGSIGAESGGHAAFPVAAEGAIKDVVQQFLGDITRIAVGQPQ